MTFERRLARLNFARPRIAEFEKRALFDMKEELDLHSA